MEINTTTPETTRTEMYRALWRLEELLDGGREAYRGETEDLRAEYSRLSKLV